MACSSLLSRAVVGLLLVFCGRAVAGNHREPAKFLIVSNAANGSLMYGKIPDRGEITDLKTLVKEGAGLTHPQGLAIDQKRNLLLVADSGIQKVVAYKLGRSGGDLLHVGDQVSVAEDVEVRWVTVDGVGNVYYTNELNNRVMMVPSKDVETEGTGQGTVVFDQSDVSAVSGPGGIATDNFYLYWTNKVDTLQHGSVVRSLKDRRPGDKKSPEEAQQLARKLPKAYGLCVVNKQVFYTEGDKNLQGMQKAGGEPVLISDEFNSPRGCAWDGENQLYVADRAANGVFVVPAPMISLDRAQIVKVLDMEEAFGVAVFSSASPRFGWRSCAALLQMALLFLVASFASSRA